MKTNILHKLKDFDGRQIEPLNDLANDIPSNNETINILINIVQTESTHIQAGATWILKCWHGNGRKFSTTQGNSLLKALPDLTSYQSVLLILQMLPDFKISQAIQNKLFNFLKSQLSHNNRFVRAWAYTGLHVIANQHDGHKEEVKTILTSASRGETGSVQTRLKSILREYETVGA